VTVRQDSNREKKHNLNLLVSSRLFTTEVFSPLINPRRAVVRVRWSGKAAVSAVIAGMQTGTEGGGTTGEMRVARGITAKQQSQSVCMCVCV
jgi:hypothetical protein